MADKQFRTITAKFQPCQEHIATLRPELLPLIGETAEFTYAWMMDDTERFPRIWALTTEDRRFLGYWIPEFDLEEIY
jgi:hypothetical protein